MKFEKITFGWRDIIYIASIIICVVLWYIDREINDVNHKNELNNHIKETNMALQNINNELGELTTFQELQSELNIWMQYHMQDKNIHKNMNP